MADLITRARALYNLANPATTADENTTLDALVSACSAVIEKYCRRDFVQAAYDELYSGNGDRRLFLRQYPIVSVQSVRYRPVTVLKIINNDTVTNQQAPGVLETAIVRHPAEPKERARRAGKCPLPNRPPAKTNRRIRTIERRLERRFQRVPALGHGTSPSLAEAATFERSGRGSGNHE
jgi:hypothetical protein